MGAASSSILNFTYIKARINTLISQRRQRITQLREQTEGYTIDDSLNSLSMNQSSRHTPCAVTIVELMNQ